MARTLIAADDVLATPPGGVIDAPPGCLVTPLARDLAKDRGITIADGAAERPAGRPETSLEDRVREVVASVMAEATAGQGRAGRATVKLVRGSEARMDRFPFRGPPEDMDVRTGDVVTSSDGSPMGAGYMTITQGSFEWSFDYDEVQIVLEGELRLGGDGGDRTARAGDIFFVPKGSRVTFSTPTWARFVYVTHPADWGG